MARINLLPWRAERRTQRQKEFMTMLGAAALGAVLLSFLIVNYSSRQIDGENARIAYVKDQIAKANIDEKLIKRQEAIISSMTREERRNPKIIAAKRKIRIANGSGTSVQDVNRLLKQHQQMADMMKRKAKTRPIETTRAAAWVPLDKEIGW